MQEEPSPGLTFLIRPAEVLAERDRRREEAAPTQFHIAVSIDDDGSRTGRIDLPDVEKALEEMRSSGGSLNLKLLGAET
jgi:hypothetical protein